MTYLVLYNDSKKIAISAAASKDFLRRIAAVSRTSRHFALRPVHHGSTTWRTAGVDV